MFHNRELNPHFLPRNNEPVIEFGPQQLSMTSPPHGPRSQRTRMPVEPSHGLVPQLTRTPLDPSNGPGHQLFHTSMDPRHGPMPQLNHTPIDPNHGPGHQLFRTSMRPPHVPGPQLTRTSMEPPPGPRQPTHTSTEPPPGPTHQPTRTSTESPHGPSHQRGRTLIEPTPDPRPKLIPTSIEPPHGPRPQPHQSQPKPQMEMPSQHNQEPALHPKSHTLSQLHNDRVPRRNYHHDSSLIRSRSTHRTKPLAWLVAFFCAVFWIIVIIGGLIILTIYLVYRPKTPRFDINGVTLNAAYLDLGYLLNGDVTVLANFTNPNTKVNVDFSYVVFELHYRNNFIATRYVEPFSVLRRETRFIGVHLVTSQVRLSTPDSLELQREIERGRVILELRGMFRARSKLGGIFRYSYWLNTRCQLLVGSPPNGVLIGKRCTTK